nr:MAG TPA: hypothetical protein [Caudoviricetes sp.]DAR33025.1 MAG TPA: hypothetical protein [Caudoviricetes sp.]
MRPAWVKPPLPYTSLGRSVRGALYKNTTT